MSREHHPGECDPDGLPCGSPDCGRCLPVCNKCGGDHLTKDHVPVYPEPGWIDSLETRLIRGTVSEWRTAGGAAL